MHAFHDGLPGLHDGYVRQMSDERRYTLVEAQRELAARECAVHGHDWRVLESLARGPISIVCERCHVSHPVAHEGGDPVSDEGAKV